VETLLEGGSFFESPRWHDGRWWVSDFYRHLVLAVTAGGDAETFGPGGCGLDAEGHIWAADEVNAVCARVAPGGEVVQRIPAPEGTDVFACMLGGDDGRTLLMCVAPDFLEHNRVGATDARLVTTTVDVPRAGLP
jgi:sugar lactone lactonase YvrE